MYVFVFGLVGFVVFCLFWFVILLFKYVFLFFLVCFVVFVFVFLVCFVVVFFLGGGVWRALGCVFILLQDTLGSKTFWYVYMYIFVLLKV